MLYEISIDNLNSENRFLTESGHIASISNSLKEELEGLNVNIDRFSEAVIDFLKDDSKIYSTYMKPIKVTGNCPIFTRVLDLWITHTAGQTHVITLVSNYGDISEVMFVDPIVFNYASEKIMDIASSSECMELSMPFPYKFVVFETFNAFSKKFSTDFLGVIGHREKYLMAYKSTKAIMWKVESTKVDYLGNFHDSMIRNL
ncbi:MULTISPECIES: hypothetical protein [Acidianus]|uniref:Uncharacterized protein n=1 Tax=Candidatus Acidianus copahuensis TaxID=1160895 RepID=A0A031LIG4_9CREN|nr:MULTISPECIES: hypothetical protein [Acidianus]EZQ01917.1 hypothetical protein CM19_11695 [Candidatus Acidianus copahuensis]NON62060.1 hypothetical protein [Acidianus sp. RZ1]